MSLFDWLLVSHLVGDFLLQSQSMALYKARQWSWMLRHVGFYMIPVTIVVALYAWSYHLALWLVALVLLFVAITHIALDRRDLTMAWMRNISMAPDHPWLPVVVDQVFHILVLVVVTQVLVLAAG
jgi:hypothetical protein